MNIQTILTPAGDQMVLLSRADYDALVEAAEDHADRASMADFRMRLAHGEEELVPSAVADRIINGENPIRIWREHRGMSVKALADIVGIAPAYLSQVETGKREGTVQTLSKLAAALRVKIDDLVRV